MKKHLLMFLFLIAFLVMNRVSNAAVNVPDRAQFNVTNALSNPGFERNKAGWTASGGTFSITTTAANVGSGNASGSWDSGSASQTLASASVAITSGDGLSSQSIAGSCRIKTASGTATHKIQIYDGTSVIAETTVSSLTSFVRTSITGPAPASGNISLRLISVASDEPAIYIDDCYLGVSDGFNLSKISQSTIYGTAKHATTGSCTWTTTGGSFANFSADSDCPVPTLSGNALAPSTKVPGIRFTNLPAGKYEVSVQGAFLSAGSTQCVFQLSDGTSADGYKLINNAASSDIGNHISGVFSYTTAQSDVTFQVQGYRFSGASNCLIDNSAADERLHFTVKRFPSDVETAYRPEQVNWRVDANISGGNPSLGTGAQSSYVEITNGSLSMTQNSGSSAVGIACATGTASVIGNLTCSSNESIGVTFNAPTSGAVRACAAFIHSGQGATNSTVYQLVETSASSSTVVQEGKDRIGPTMSAGGQDAAMQVCGVFNFDSAGQKTIRLMFEQTAQGSAPVILADGNTSNGQRDIHWTVTPLTYGTPAPVLVGYPRSQVVARTFTGYGSTATKWTRWSTNSTTGSGITLVQDATQGDYMLINETGVYHITATVTFNTADRWCGLTVNNTQSTTNIYSVSDGTVYAAGNGWAANVPCLSTTTLNLTAGDKIRVQTDGTAAGTNQLANIWTVTQVSK